MAVCSPLSDSALRVWLGGLHQLALADGDFDAAEQRTLRNTLSEQLVNSRIDWHGLRAPEPAELAEQLGCDSNLTEQFLRSAMVVALADGHLSPKELDLIQSWVLALGCSQELLHSLKPCDGGIHPLDPLRDWLDGFQPEDPGVAAFIVQLIPAQCPFERDITLFGHKLVHIPSMCKINPLYDQLIGLRFRCLNQLSEQEQMRLSRSECTQP